MIVGEFKSTVDSLNEDSGRFLCGLNDALELRLADLWKDSLIAHAHCRSCIHRLAPDTSQIFASAKAKT